MTTASEQRQTQSAGDRGSTGDEFLVLEEVADICRASLSTVRFWVRTGRLRSYRPGRRRLVRREDMLTFIEQGGAGMSANPQPRMAELEQERVS